MGSRRLPGKILMPLAGRPMLAHILELLRAARRPATVIVATSGTAQDDPTAGLAKSLGVEVFRGSESDVLDRYYRCAAAARKTVRAAASPSCPRAAGSSPS